MTARSANLDVATRVANHSPASTLAEHVAQLAAFDSSLSAVLGGILSEVRAIRESLPPQLEMASSNVGNLLLTAQEASTALGISDRTLWSQTAPRGPIPSVRIGGRVLYDPADLHAFIESQKSEVAK